MTFTTTNPVLDLIKNTIKGTAFENNCYVAGGFVRDLVMGNVSKDIDIVVELPKGGILLANFLASKLSLRHPVIYERFGTAQLEINGEQVEFVMSRKEIYFENNRKPECSFGTIKDDVYRRDFTINSLLYNISTGEVLDLTGMGLSDIGRGVIRTTSEPDSIFTEDPLRMLRAIRFACKFGFTILSSTWDEIVKSAWSIKHISAERIRVELEKILTSSNPGIGIRMLVDSFILADILPELYLLKGMDQGRHHRLDGLDHTIEVVEGVEATVTMRMAAFLHDIGKPADRIINETGVHFYGHEDTSAKIAEDFLKKMKFSNKEVDTIVTLIKEHMSVLKGEKSMKSARKVRMRVGAEMFKMILDHTEADLKASLGIGLDWVETLRTTEFTEKSLDKLPVSGTDIMTAFGLKQGPEVGRLLDKVREMISEDPTLTKEELLKKL